MECFLRAAYPEGEAALLQEGFKHILLCKCERLQRLYA